MSINIIYAKDVNNGISKNNKIPWFLKKDLQWFQKLTMSFMNIEKKNVVVMGNKTWQSIPSNYKPLKNRINIILSKNNFDNLIDETKNLNNTMVISNIDEIFSYYNLHKPVLWIIGGKQIYEYFLKYSNYVFVTKIFSRYNCDNMLNDSLLNTFDNIFTSSVNNENGINFQYIVYKNNNAPMNTEYDNNDVIKYITNDCNILYGNHLDIDYLNLVKDILSTNNIRNTRNGETISSFGKHLKINLKEGFPLLTTKKVFWKGVLKELLWFLKAETDSKTLSENGVRIWDQNTTRQFLDSLNLPYDEGIGGPIYGWQWRKFNEKYPWKDSDSSVSYTEGNEKGFDQLQFIIDEIRRNPSSRRLVMSGWNPNQLDQMCLPPCHMSYQFYVNHGNLSCQMYQRSADVFLGLPFNIASTALLTHIIANHCNLGVDSIFICIGDAHIYKDHLESIHQQMSRIDDNYYSLPKLIIKSQKERIEDYVENDFEIIGYNSSPAIRAKMLA
jgi:dihydrofolate reductase / thymidylate synthase